MPWQHRLIRRLGTPSCGHLGWLGGVCGDGAGGVWIAGRDQNPGSGIVYAFFAHRASGSSTWTTYRVGDAFNLSGVSALAFSATNDIWATAHDEPFLILTPGNAVSSYHWNGTAWSTALNNLGAHFGGFPLTRLASNDIWIPRTVISAVTSSRHLHHWDGAVWQELVETTSHNVMRFALAACPSGTSGQFWSAGQYGTLTGSSILGPYAELCGGGSSSTDYFLNTGDTGGIYGLHYFSASSIWAVGASTTLTLSEYQAVTWKFDGAAWAMDTTHLPPIPSLASGSHLLGVDALSTSDVWAVGEWFDALGAVRVYIVHWNGSTWTQFLPDVDYVGGVTDTILSNVYMIATDDVWAVGSSACVATGDQQVLVLHYDGVAWTTVRVP